MNSFEAILCICIITILIIAYFKLIKPMQKDIDYIKNELYPFFADLVGSNGFSKLKKKIKKRKSKRRKKS